MDAGEAASAGRLADPSLPSSSPWNKAGAFSWHPRLEPSRLCSAVDGVPHGHDLPHGTAPLRALLSPNNCSSPLDILPPLFLGYLLLSALTWSFRNIQFGPLGTSPLQTAGRCLHPRGSFLPNRGLSSIYCCSFLLSFPASNLWPMTKSRIVFF